MLHMYHPISYLHPSYNSIRGNSPYHVHMGTPPCMHDTLPTNNHSTHDTRSTCISGFMRC